MASHLEIEIFLTASANGGLQHAVTGGEWRTVLSTGGESWSARLFFQGELVPGESGRALAQFLAPEALKHSPVGGEFAVWHGGMVASWAAAAWSRLPPNNSSKPTPLRGAA